MHIPDDETSTVIFVAQRSRLNPRAHFTDAPASGWLEADGRQRLFQSAHLKPRLDKGQAQPLPPLKLCRVPRCKVTAIQVSSQPCSNDWWTIGRRNQAQRPQSQLACWDASGGVAMAGCKQR